MLTSHSSAQPGSPDSNGAAVFECGSEGYANAANYCCENGFDAKTACCATSSLIFELGPGTYGSMSPSTSASIVSTQPTATVTSTVISDQSYTTPSTTSQASSTPLPVSVTSYSRSAPTGSLSNGTVPRISSLQGLNVTATAAVPSTFTGAAGRNVVPLVEYGVIALAAAAYL